MSGSWLYVRLVLCNLNIMYFTFRVFWTLQFNQTYWNGFGRIALSWNRWRCWWRRNNKGMLTMESHSAHNFSHRQYPENLNSLGRHGKRCNGVMSECYFALIISTYLFVYLWDLDVIISLHQQVVLCDILVRDKSTQWRFWSMQLMQGITKLSWKRVGNGIKRLIFMEGFSPHLFLQTGWMPVRRGRFPTVCIVKSKDDEDECIGVFLRPQHILVPAHCVSRGDHPTKVVVNPDGPRDTRFPGAIQVRWHLGMCFSYELWGLVHCGFAFDNILPLFINFSLLRKPVTAKVCTE